LIIRSKLNNPPTLVSTCIFKHFGTKIVGYPQGYH
jgi:hypothetical protein